MQNSIMRTLMTEFLEELEEGKAVPETVPFHPRPRQASVAGEEQRQSKRHEATGDSVLLWKDRAKGRVGSPAVARNVSKYGLQVEVSVPVPVPTVVRLSGQTYGLQVEVSVPVPVPTVVRLSGQTLECVGSTCYCRTVEDAVQETFLVGIRFLGQPYPKEERPLHELRLTSRSL